MLHFVAALKAHAKLRCTFNEEKLDEEKYAKMTYWVCAYAKIRFTVARGKASWSCVGVACSGAACEGVHDVGGGGRLRALAEFLIGFALHLQ